MFLFRRAKITVSQEPDIRPMVSLLYAKFCGAGIPCVTAARAAIVFVIDDLFRHIVLHGLDVEIVDRIAIMHEVTDEALRWNELAKRQVRIMLCLNVLMAMVTTVFFVLLITRMLVH